MFLSKNLCYLRARAAMSMEALAEIIGVSRQAIAKWESGVSLPDIQNCYRLSEFFGVTMDALVTLDMSQSGVGELDGKFMFGAFTVDENMTVPLPEKVRNVFDIKVGDMMIMLGDRQRGIAIIKCDKMQ